MEALFSSLIDACQKGHLQVLKEGFSQCHEQCIDPFQMESTSLFNVASESDSRCGVDILEELITEYRRWSKRAQRKGKGSGLIAHLCKSRTPEGYTALHCACKSKKLDFVYVFVKELHFYGGMSTAADTVTPFELACQYNCIKIALFLLQKCKGCYEDFSSGLIIAYRLEQFKLITEVCKVHKVTVKVLNSLCQQTRHDIVDFCITEKLCKQEGRQLLEMAVSQGEIELIKYLFTKSRDDDRFDIKSVDKNGNNLLHVACSANQLTSIECLLEYQHFTIAMSKNKKGERPISIAFKNEFFDILNFLESFLQLSPLCLLFIIPQELNISMSVKKKFSLEQMTEPLQQDKCGNSPLHYACENGQFGFIHVLLKTPMLDLSVKNVDGNTPVHLLSQQMCKMLKTVEFTSRKQGRYKEIILRDAMITCFKRMLSYSTFNPCIRNDKEETVVFILLTKLNIFKSNFYAVFDSLLEIAVERYSSDALNEDVVKIVKHYCQYYLRGKFEQKEKHPFINFISKLMASQHFNPNAADANGDTCLHFAIACYWTQLFEHLLTLPQISVNVKNKSGKTPLQSIVGGKFEMYTSRISISIALCNIVARLIDLKVEVNFEPYDDEGNTLLHIACYAKSVTLLEKLAEISGIKKVLNVLNKRGKSPLHLLCSNARHYVNAKCFKVLLRFDEIDVNLCTKSGETPLEIFTSDGNQKSIMYEEIKHSIVEITHHPTFKPELYVKPEFLTIWCKAGIVKLVEQIFSKNKMSVKKLNRFNQNFLHIACLNFNPEIVKFLMTLETSENHLLARDYYKGTPFHSLCWRVSAVSKDVLVRKEADDRINQALKIFESLAKCRSLHQVINELMVAGKAPLHLLSQVRYFKELFKAVLNVPSIDVNVRDLSSNTPLHIACQQKQFNKIEFLLAHPKIDITVTNHIGQSPFSYFDTISSNDSQQQHLARRKDRVFRRLTLHSPRNDCQSSFISALISENIHEKNPILFLDILSVSDGNDNTTLHIACQLMKTDAILLLLSMPAVNVKSINNQKRTPLHIFLDKMNQLDRSYLLILYLFKVHPSYSTDMLSIQDEDGNTCLHLACKTSALELFISDSGKLVAVKNVDGNTPLHIACIHSQVKSVSFLLQQKSINVCDVNAKKQTAFHVIASCQKKSEDYEIYCKLKKHCSFNEGILEMQDNNGDTCLHVACRSGNQVMIADMCRQVNVNIQNRDGKTALHWSSEPLLDESVFCDLAIQDNFGNNPVWFVLQELNKSRRINISRYIQAYIDWEKLLKSSSTASSFSEVMDMVKHFLINKTLLRPASSASEVMDVWKHVVTNETFEKCINQVNDDGESVLHLACASFDELKQKQEIVESMLSLLSCNPNIANKNGKTPFHILAEKNYKLFDKFCKKYTKIDLSICDNEHNTPLHILLSSVQKRNDFRKLGFNSDPTVSDTDLAHESSQKTAYDESDLNVVNKNGDTALHVACSLNFPYYIKVLSEAMRDINCQNKDRKTPFHCLYSMFPRNEQFFDECWQVLVSHPSFNPNIQDNKGLTVLHYECMLSSPDVSLLAILLQHKDIDVSLQSNSGDTCLHLAHANFGSENLEKLIDMLSKHKQKSIETEYLPFQQYFNPYHGIYSKHHDLCQCNDEITKYRSASFSALSVLDQYGNTALHLACQAVCPTAIKRLLQSCRKKMSNFPTNHSKQTPLHMLALGIKRQFTFFLSKSSNPMREKELSAMRKKVRALMKYDWYVLLKCGINKKDDSGNTALHYVCEAQSTAMLKILSSNNSCRFDIRNNAEDLPIAVAHKTRNRNFVLKFLIKYFEKQDNQHLVNYYKTVLKDGAIPMRPVKCIITGPPAAGKSTLKRRLLGEVLPEISTSTGVADSPQIFAVRSVSQEQVSVSSGGMKWTPVDCRDQVEALLQTLLSNVQDAIENLEPVTLIPPSTHTAANVSVSLPHIADIVSASKQTRVFRSTYKEWAERQRMPRVKKPRESFEHQVKELQTLVNSVAAKKSKDDPKKFSVGDLKKNPFVRIIDTGGQPELHELLPAFVTGPAINLIVFRLDKPLDEHYPIYYRSENSNSLCYESSLSHKDIILRSLASIACLGYGQQLRHTDDDESVEPVAFLIASHKDKVDNGEVKLTNEHVESLIKNGDFIQKNIVEYCNKECIIFAVNNLDAQCHEIDTLRKRIFNVIEREFKPIDVPMTWLLLSIKLQRLMEKKEFKSVVDIDECFEIAQTCGILSIEDLQDVLWFFHNAMGIVMHFPQVPELQSKVILDIQATLNCITQLITSCFLFENIGSKPAEEDFAKRGYFTLESLKKVVHSKNISKNKENIPFTAGEIIALMRRLYVIAPMKDRYFMPSALKPTKLKPVDQSSFSLPPLLVSFECGYCPVGVFTSLVAYLLSSATPKCHLADDSNQFRNRMKILFGPYNNELTLVAHANYFEIWLCRTAPFGMCTNLAYVCQQTRTLINEGITTVTKSLHYKYTSQHHFGFVCTHENCYSSPLHPAIYDEHAEPRVRVARCVRTKNIIPLSSEQLDWYGIKGESLTVLTAASIDDIPGEILDKELDIKDLDDVCDLLINDLVGWKPLGHQLGLQWTTLKKIEIEERRVNVCIMEMLASWLQKADNVATKGGPCWRQLITALQRGESEEDPIIANHIINELKQRAN